MHFGARAVGAAVAHDAGDGFRGVTERRTREHAQARGAEGTTWIQDEHGFVVDFDSGTPVVTDGPYTEAKELFNGFWVLAVSSIEEAKQWAVKCPLGPGARLEVRRITETEEFPQDNEWVQKELRWKKEGVWK